MAIACVDNTVLYLIQAARLFLTKQFDHYQFLHSLRNTEKWQHAFM